MAYSYTSGSSGLIDDDFRNFGELLPYVLPQTPTCSNMLALQQIERAARELCQKSRIWRITQHPLPLDNSTCEYEFEPLEGADRVQIEWATYEGIQLKPTTERQLFKCDPGWLLKEGRPTHYLEMNAGLIRLWPTPMALVQGATPPSAVPTMDDEEPSIAAAGQSCSVIFRISMKPALGATALDKQVFDDYYDTIVNGALGFLMFMPGKAWSNPELAAAYANDYHVGIERARRQAVDGNLQPDRVMQYGGL